MKSKTIKLGVVGVDSGQLMICDPCYLYPEFMEGPGEDQDRAAPAGEFSYPGICQMIASKRLGGQLNYPMGHAGAGVAFLAGYGDGVYEVFAEIIEDTEYGERIKKIWVELIPDEAE